MPAARFSPPDVGLILELPALDPIFGALRAEHDWTARRGTPPHVTLIGGTHHLGPSTAELLAFAPAIAIVLERFEPITFTFAHIGRYPEALVLPVGDDAIVRALTHAVCEACGLQPRASFHVTLARSNEETLDELSDAVAQELPVTVTADRVSLSAIDPGTTPHADREFASWQLT